MVKLRSNDYTVTCFGISEGTTFATSSFKSNLANLVLPNTHIHTFYSIHFVTNLFKIYQHLHAGTHMHTHIHMHAHIHTHTRTHTHTHIYTCTHSHTHTYIYSHTFSKCSLHTI